MKKTISIGCFRFSMPLNLLRTHTYSLQITENEMICISKPVHLNAQILHCSRQRLLLYVWLVLCASKCKSDPHGLKAGRGRGHHLIQWLPILAVHQNPLRSFQQFRYPGPNHRLLFQTEARGWDLKPKYVINSLGMILLWHRMKNVYLVFFPVPGTGLLKHPW